MNLDVETGSRELARNRSPGETVYKASLQTARPVDLLSRFLRASYQDRASYHRVVRGSVVKEANKTMTLAGEGAVSLLLVSWSF